MAKRVQVSADGIAWYTLPGNSGELRSESGELNDTIFGQDFSSAETGLLNWTLNSNAIWKGFAGYIVNLKKSGTPTVMTGEAMTLVSGKIYQVTATAKQIISTAHAVVVKDNAVDHNADVISIDYLTGTIEFDAGYTVTGPVTIDAYYLPTSAIAGAKSFSLTQSAETIDETDIPLAKANGGWQIFSQGLKTASMEISGIYKTSNAFLAALISRASIIVEINPDNNNLSICRGIFKYSGQGLAGDVGALEEETINLRLNVPDIEKAKPPFTWIHSNLSTINPGIKLLLTAWLTGDNIYARYLPDGSAGQEGEAVITDVSLSGGLEAMNEFTVNLQGSGQLEPVP